MNLNARIHVPTYVAHYRDQTTELTCLIHGPNVQSPITKRSTLVQYSDKLTVIMIKIIILNIIKRKTNKKFICYFLTMISANSCC